MKFNAGSSGLITRVKGGVRPIQNRVIVNNMEFGERTTAGGIIISSDDGKDSGIKPRWGQVVVKGNDNADPYQVGDWILIEHGRWTRGFEVELEDGTIETMRTVEAESILGWQQETPEDVLFGSMSGAGSVDQAKPEDFGAR
jgi:co-chaperonin GroES (HSP10)